MNFKCLLIGGQVELYLNFLVLIPGVLQPDDAGSCTVCYHFQSIGRWKQLAKIVTKREREHRRLTRTYIKTQRASRMHKQCRGMPLI